MAGLLTIQKASGGVLNVTSTDGATSTDLVLPLSGTVLSNDNGVVNITGTGSRITGDFSSSPHSNRVAFQTSTTDSATGVYITPNGISTDSSIRCTNSSDRVNYSDINAFASATVVGINSEKFGTGSYLPMIFSTGGSERMRIDTSGNVGIGTTPSAWYPNLVKAIDIGNSSFYATGASDVQMANNSYLNSGGSWIYKQNGYASTYYQLTGTHNWRTALSGTAGNVITWKDTMSLDANGNLLLTSGTGALGYGTGSGGTVTQLTSKSTTVSLNKPTGRINMSNSALAAGASVTFTLNNTFISDNDIVNINVAAAYPSYEVMSTNGSNGCYITVKNKTAGSLSEAVILIFAITKGAIS